MLKIFQRLLNFIKDYKEHRKNGFIPQEVDSRDYIYEEDYVVSGAENAPLIVDLRMYCSFVKNQGRTEACTGFAAAALLEVLLKKDYQIDRNLSELYLWAIGKEKHGWVTENKGVWLRHTLNQIWKLGFVYEENMPFKEPFLIAPNPTVKKVGMTSTLYVRKLERHLLRPESVKDAISKERPVVFGVRLNDSFYGNRSGIITSTNPRFGSHAMLVVGFNDRDQTYIVRNSWGRTWGDKGYCYIPMDWFHKHAHDCWTITDPTAEDRK